MDETDAVLVNGDEEVLGVVGLGGLFHFKKGGAKRWPPVDDLEERHFSVFRAQT
jgi:hypothetical protein